MWSKSNKFDQEKGSWQKLEVSTNWGMKTNIYIISNKMKTKQKKKKSRRQN